jgi:signal transduction histidine kinase
MIGSRLFHRIYISLLIAVLATLALAGVVSHHWLGEGTHSPYAVRLAAEARVIAAALPAQGAPVQELQAQLAARAKDLDLDAALFDAHGTALAATSARMAAVQWGAPKHGWVWTQEGPAHAFGVADGRWLAVRPRGGAPGHVAFGLALVALFVALGIACYPVARGLARRLETLEAGVRQFGAGRLGARVSLAGADEVARVAASFNWAAERIERLVEAQRRVLANASHELRSPLARLRMALELMRGDLGAAGEGRVNEAVAEIEELDDLVEDILIASRIEAGGAAGPLEEVDLAALLAAEAERVGATVETRTSLTVRSEARMIKRMLRNLLENARLHGGGSGIVAGVEAPGETSDGVRVWVADRGPGVPAEERERIFERFYRASRTQGSAAEGVGLGLALVREIAEHHGGGATCRARDGGGTLFEVTLRNVQRGAASS